MEFTELYCLIDDYIKSLYRHKILQKEHCIKRGPKYKLSLSEITTIVIGFQYFSRVKFANFKAYYTYLMIHHKSEFPTLSSYNRFIELQQLALLPIALLSLMKRSQSYGTTFIDSCSLKVCHNKRIYSNKVFKGIAQRGKTSVGWFFGFKLHLVINHIGEIINFTITPGNVHDKKPVPVLLKNIQGKVFGDRGYIDKRMFKKLFKNGIKLITKIRENMDNQLMDMEDKILLKKRGIVESVFNLLKSRHQIEHSRHRSPINFIINLFSGILAFMLNPQKPKSRGVSMNVLN